MRDKQQIKYVKQRFMYLHTYEKGLDRGKICEASTPIKAKIWIRVFGQAPTYREFKLRTHAHDMRACGLFKTLTQKWTKQKTEHELKPEF